MAETLPSCTPDATDEPQQMLLFDLGVDLGTLKRERESFMKADKAANTTRAYDCAWRMFTDWCAEAGRASLPASGETISLYVVDLLKQQRKLSTIEVKLAAITKRHTEAGHLNPVDAATRQLLANAGRLRKEQPQSKAPFTPEHLRKILRHTQVDDVTVLRDRTILILGFALGWRRSELVALDLRDISFKAKGMVISLGASKTDQAGKGREVPIPYGHGETCPVRAVKRWIEVRGRWQGPLFTQIFRTGRIEQRRLTGHSVAIILKHYLELIGIDSSIYSAHSLRSGMATAAAENGAPEISIMARGGWKHLGTMQGYCKVIAGFRADPLQGVI